MPRLRGARPSPRHRLASAMPHRIVGPTPAQWLWLPKTLSMWLNDVDGDCVTAEECFAKACSTPELFITDATVLAWATANGVLNGADLTQVLDLMRASGFQQDGKLYNDGDKTAVDWTDAAVLQNAIAQGPVKIGVAADQLENVVPYPATMGWMATDFQPDSNEDHCVSLCGFGTISWLWAMINEKVPTSLRQAQDVNVDGSQPAYALFTWDSIGIIDVPSMLAITGEAWLRNPVTVLG